MINPLETTNPRWCMWCVCGVCGTRAVCAGSAYVVCMYECVYVCMCVYERARRGCAVSCVCMCVDVMGVMLRNVTMC